ncbi:hypothetical protein CFC21_111970 [Triticum aestivum]|uniref:AAA+ ATPase domain-containing protein n=2 Tax=Triticum aestivum TaxID=4565 RepID=A0A9R1NFK7_WHEAT|nr:hypothetical protein CFC21_111970 [Triticum aestivum]
MDALLGAAQWVVSKALAPVADGLLEAWGATRNLGPNIEALRMELLLVKATLENAGLKHTSGHAMEELLGKLQDLAYCAEDLLDELDYFRIHDQLHDTYDAADQHAKGGVHDLALNARHVAKAVGKLTFVSSFCCSAPKPAGDTGEGEDVTQRVSRCAWLRARKRSDGNSSSLPNANQEVGGCMAKLGKLLPCSSSPHVRDDSSGQPILCGVPQRETPMVGFNRVDASERMRHIVEQLQPVRKEVTLILQSCSRVIVPTIDQSLPINRPITSGTSVEPKLYGRDHIVDTIIHDMTMGKYLSFDLTVLPIVGPGGIGKTTLIQHIHKTQQVQNHFQVVIWACVSLKFNLNKLLEEIKTYIPQVEGEKGGSAEELIEQRLKSKRFLLVLDDIWEISDEDEWEKLLLLLRTSSEKGSMIIVTTRFPSIAKIVGTVDRSIKLKGLESEFIRELFHAFVFGDDQCRKDHNFLLETGDKIMIKLKGSPLAAKTVGRLLRKNLNLRHWTRVLESKEWESQTSVNDIMPALKLSYDYLPFHLQRCFSYSALFPEDYHFNGAQLVNLWIGLDILQPGDRTQTFEDIGFSNLNDLVTYGFFREDKTNGRLCYVMHDLLHDLALQVISHECISLHRSNVGLVKIQPFIRHLSIIIDGGDDSVSRENFKSQLRKLKTSLKIKQLHTLMLFGEMDESFVNTLGDLFREANALRVLRLDETPYYVESILPNFSALVHLRYLYLGTKCESEMHVLLIISRFYHLRILGLGSWYHNCHLPKELSNLVNMRRFYTPADELHSDIVNVGKLKHLEELMVFRVNKKFEGFEPCQLEHLTELRELGIYNLENIHTKEEAAKTNLGEKIHLEKLTLDWDNERSNTEPGAEAVVLESLQPHRYLQELCIRGHKGSSFPTWLGDKVTVESLHLSGVSWQCLPPLGKMWGLGKVVLEHIPAMEEFVIEQSLCKLIRVELVGLGSFGKWVASQDADHMFPLLQVLIIKDCPKLLELPFASHIIYPSDQDRNSDWFPKLQELCIEKCPELLLVAHIPWTDTLHSVNISDVKLLDRLVYSTNSFFGGRCLDIAGKDDLQSLDEVVAFSKLACLERLLLHKCPALKSKHLLLLTSLKKLMVEGSDGVVVEGDVEWQHPLEHLVVQGEESCGKELTELLTHLPSISKLEIEKCEKITQLSVGLDVQQTTSSATEVEEKEEDDSGLLLLPAQLSGTLQLLSIRSCPELVLVDPPFLLARGGLQALRSLKTLQISLCPKILSAKSSPFCCPFPSSLQQLHVEGVEGMGNLGHLLTAGGQLILLSIGGCPGFFAGWDQELKQQLLNGGKEQELQQLVSPQNGCKLQELYTDDAMGILSVPICNLLSSSLSILGFFGNQEMECFTKDQEDALHLLVSLQKLMFINLSKLQSLPAGLQKLTNLKELSVWSCPLVRSLPEDGLPKSLQELDVWRCGSAELTQQCQGLVGTIPKIFL